MRLGTEKTVPGRGEIMRCLCARTSAPAAFPIHRKHVSHENTHHALTPCGLRWLLRRRCGRRWSPLNNPGGGRFTGRVIPIPVYSRALIRDTVPTLQERGLRRRTRIKWDWYQCGITRDDRLFKGLVGVRARGLPDIAAAVLNAPSGFGGPSTELSWQHRRKCVAL